MIRRLLASSFFLVLFATGANAAQLINGAGATFPYPLYSKWFAEYQKVKPEVALNYQSLGSGAGIQQLIKKTVDFGATDSPMTDEQIQKAGEAVLHVPTVLGAVVLTYNLPGFSGSLKLTPEIVAEIFLGKITKWNDGKIASANPGAKLPDAAVIVAHRADGSGTTGIFTDYLSKINGEWKSSVGTGTAVKWPTGLGGKGNEGVTGLIKQTPGAIGYVELIYAETNKLPVALLQNSGGQFVKPSIESVTAAAASAMIPEDFRVSITNASGKSAYPISGFTYLLVYKKMAAAKGKLLVEFLRWAVKDGQKYAAPLSYAPLPKEVARKAEAAIGEISLQ